MIANPMNELWECINSDCNWVGPLRECCEFKHGSRPFCPNCREVVEASGAYEATPK